MRLFTAPGEPEMPLRHPCAAVLLVAGVLSGCVQDVPESVPSNAIPAATPGASPEAASPTPPVEHARPSVRADREGALEAGVCSLDAINGAAVGDVAFEQGSNAMFSGWVGNALKQVPEAPVLIFRGAGSSHGVTFTAGGSRPDVAAAHGSDALKTSGFNIPVRMEGLPPGRYTLAVLTDPSEVTYCDLQAEIEIRP